MLFTPEDQKKQENNPFEAQAINDMAPINPSKSQKGMLIFLYIITLSIYYWVVNIGKMNSLNSRQNKINESASGIDVQLQKRFDTLTKLVDAVKGHVEFNKDVYENIAKYRSNYQNNNESLTEKNNTLNRISTGLSMAFENYPSLGADDSIRKLMTESTMIEKEIAAARRLYNAEVTSFNTEIYNFPMNAVVSKKGYRALNLFKADESVRKDVKINF